MCCVFFEARKKFIIKNYLHELRFQMVNYTMEIILQQSNTTYEFILFDLQIFNYEILA
jgi:hypothetical protein